MPLNKHKSIEARSYGFSRTMIACSFFPNGSSAVSQTTIRGKNPGIVSISRTGTGAFSIVFDDNIIDKDFIGMFGAVQSNTAVGLHVEFGPYTAATKTLTFTTMVGNTATDIAASVNSRVSLLFIMALRGDNR